MPAAGRAGGLAMGKHYPSHACERPGCDHVTRNLHYCSNNCLRQDTHRRQAEEYAAKAHPCAICGEPTLRVVCSNPECKSEYLHRTGLSRVKHRMRTCNVCGRELPIRMFHRKSPAGNYYYGKTCHRCQAKNIPGEESNPKPRPTRVNQYDHVFVDTDPGKPALPVAVDAHGRNPAILWGDLHLGDPCCPIPGTATNATPFAA